MQPNKDGQYGGGMKEEPTLLYCAQHKFQAVSAEAMALHQELKHPFNTDMLEPK